MYTFDRLSRPEAHHGRVESAGVTSAESVEHGYSEGAGNDRKSDEAYYQSPGSDFDRECDDVAPWGTASGGLGAGRADLGGPTLGKALLCDPNDFAGGPHWTSGQQGVRPAVDPGVAQRGVTGDGRFNQAKAVGRGEGEARDTRPRDIVAAGPSDRLAPFGRVGGSDVISRPGVKIPRPIFQPTWVGELPIEYRAAEYDERQQSSRIENGSKGAGRRLSRGAARCGGRATAKGVHRNIFASKS